MHLDKNFVVAVKRPLDPRPRLRRRRGSFWEFSGGGACTGVGAAASWFPPTTQETLLGEALGWIEHIWHHNINPCVL